MTTASVLLPSGLRYVVDGLIDAARIGMRRFWRGGACANAPAGEAVALLNRLMRILRYAFVILATYIELTPLRPQAKRAWRSPRVHLRKPTLQLFPRYKIVWDDAPKHPQPAAFARATRDRFLTAQRKLEALARALADPMPLVRRMARKLPTQLVVIGCRPPRRPPPTDKRDFWEDLVNGFTEAKFTLGEWRRRRRDIEREASESAGSGEREACADD